MTGGIVGFACRIRVHFPAGYQNPGRGRNSQTDLFATNLLDHNADIVSDDDFLSRFTCQCQHDSFLFPSGRDRDVPAGKPEVSAERKVWNTRIRGKFPQVFFFFAIFLVLNVASSMSPKIIYDYEV